MKRSVIVGVAIAIASAVNPIYAEDASSVQIPQPSCSNRLLFIISGMNRTRDEVRSKIVPNLDHPATIRDVVEVSSAETNAVHQIIDYILSDCDHKALYDAMWKQRLSIPSSK